MIYMSCLPDCTLCGAVGRQAMLMAWFKYLSLAQTGSCGGGLIKQAVDLEPENPSK